MDDDRVLGIRTSELVGLGSCSQIDECLTDEELATSLDSCEITDPIEAERWAVQRELWWLEQGLNQREGEDDDPQLVQYNEFKTAADAFLS